MWIFEFNSLTFTFHNAVDPRGEQPSIVVRALQYIHLVVNDLGTSYITYVIYTLQDQTKPNSLKKIQICNLPLTSSHTKLYNITQILHIHEKCNNMKWWLPGLLWGPTHDLYMAGEQCSTEIQHFGRLDTNPCHWIMCCCWVKVATCIFCIPTMNC